MRVSAARVPEPQVLAEPALVSLLGLDLPAPISPKTTVPSVTSFSVKRSLSENEMIGGLGTLSVRASGAARAARATRNFVVVMALIMRANENERKVKGR